MTITNLKELAKLIDLCRKKGIESIEVSGISIKLGSIPSRKVKDEAVLDPVPQYSDEDILTWSTHNLDGVG